MIYMMHVMQKYHVVHIELAFSVNFPTGSGCHPLISNFPGHAKV